MSLDGERLALDALWATGKPALLVFTEPGCSPCGTLLPEVARWQRRHAATVNVAVIGTGDIAANRPKAEEHGITKLLLQSGREVAAAYQVHGTPSAVVVRPDGAIGSPLAQGADAIRALVDRTTRQSRTQVADTASTQIGDQARGGRPLGGPPPGSEHGAPSPPRGPLVGEPVLAFSLPDLAGKQRSLVDFRGSPTLVLLWDPACGFCQQMLPDIARWEDEPPEGSPQLLVVSTGGVEVNRAMGLRSLVLLDSGFSAGAALGAGGTPSAVMVDAEGRVAAPMAVGRRPILKQLNVRWG